MAGVAYSKRRTYRHRRHYKPHRAATAAPKRTYKPKNTVALYKAPNSKSYCKPCFTNTFFKRQHHKGHSGSLSHVKSGDRQLLPDQFTTKMVYVQATRKESLVATIISDPYMNSVYRPEVESTVNCEGMSEMKNFYTKFRVDGVELVVEGQNLSDANPILVFIGSASYLSWGGALSTSATNYGLPTAIRDLEGDRNVDMHIVGESKSFKFKKYFAFHAIEGVTKQAYKDDSNYSGTMETTTAALPAFNPCVYTSMASFDQSTSSPCWWVTRLVYYVTFFGVEQVAHPTSLSRIPIGPPKEIVKDAPASDSDESTVNLDTLTKSQVTKIKAVIKK